MKKLIIIVPLIMLIAGCMVIEERYRVRGVYEPAPADYYEYSPVYDSYYPSYYAFSPYWIGLGWWNPFWHYGFYNTYYYGYYYPYYYGYYSYYPSRNFRRYGKSRITKDQLRNPRSGDTRTRVTRTRTSGKTGTTRGTVSRTRIKKSGAGRSRVTRSRGSSGRSRGTVSRGSSGTKVKKKK